MNSIVNILLTKNCLPSQAIKENCFAILPNIHYLAREIPSLIPKIACPIIEQAINFLIYFVDNEIDVHVITIEPTNTIQNPSILTALPKTSTLQNTIVKNKQINNATAIISKSP